MNNTIRLAHLLQKYSHDFFAVVPFDKVKDNLLHMNFTSSNTELTAALLIKLPHNLFNTFTSRKK